MSGANGYVEVDSGKIYYSITGSGAQDIIWMHGLPLDSSSWYAQTQYFDHNFRNICFDMRGYGNSSKLPVDVKSVSDLYVSDLQHLIAQLQLNKPILVAFASGGHGALRFAARHSGLISKLVVINGSPTFMSKADWPSGFDAASLQKFVAAIDAADTIQEICAILFDPAMRENCPDCIAKLQQWFMPMAEKAGKATIKAFFTNIAYDDDRELVQQIAVPTLILSSTLGTEVPSKVSMFLRENIKDSILVELSNLDHFCFATNAPYVNSIIEQFIAPRCEILIP